MQPFLAAFLFPKTKDKLLCPNNIHKMYCLFWAQDTNFKAIHNQYKPVDDYFAVVYHLQKHKISKQFTTPLLIL